MILSDDGRSVCGPHDGRGLHLRFRRRGVFAVRRDLLPAERVGALDG